MAWRKFLQIAGRLCVLAWAFPLATAPAEAAAPWTIETAQTAGRPGGPKILLTYDMEGLSGQDDVYTWHSTHRPQYEKGRRLLTDDVNAVIDGLFEGGAGAVSVLDCHGGGNTEIDILIDEVDPRATVVTEAPVYCGRTYAERGRFDAIAAVAMHAGSGSGGFSAHTSTLGIEIVVNGKSVNETELAGLAYGEAGIPVIFASGDDILGQELRSMPWVEYVEVKKALGPMSASLVPLDEARERLAVGAARAVRGLIDAKIMKASVPVAVTVRAFSPADFDYLRPIPGVELHDGSVSFVEPDYRKASRRTGQIVSAAMYNNYRILVEEASRHPDWRYGIEARAVERLTRLWNESEEARSRAALPRDR